MRGEVLGSREMRILDANSEYFGVSVARLMENAGRGVAKVVEERFGAKGKRIAVLCGTGNNGGDGFVAARYLAERGALVSVLLVGMEGKIGTTEARKNWDKLKGLGRVKCKIFKRVSDVDAKADVIIDALLGTGVKGELREPFESVVEKVNSTKVPKVSIDVPSGMDADTGKGECIDADLVIALHAPKKGAAKLKSVLVDIDMPEEAWLYVGPGDVAVNLGKRKPDSHKGENGRVLVVGGSELYSGAPALAAFGALNSGADLVVLAVPEANFDVTRSYSPDFIVRKYKGEFLNSGAVDTIIELAGQSDALVIGPGLGVKKETREAVLNILKKVRLPVVIDADALKFIGGKEGSIKPGDVVLTPHAGEFKALSGKNAREKEVADYAKEHKFTVLMKAREDLIASPEGKLRKNATGNAGMTVGGTGDVLSGVVAGFIAQGLSAFDSACCAAFVTGAAGDELEEWKGYAYMASDLAEEIPLVLKKLL